MWNFVEGVILIGEIVICILLHINHQGMPQYTAFERFLLSYFLFFSFFKFNIEIYINLWFLIVMNRIEYL